MSFIKRNFVQFWSFEVRRTKIVKKWKTILSDCVLQKKFRGIDIFCGSFNIFKSYLRFLSILLIRFEGPNFVAFIFVFFWYFFKQPINLNMRNTFTNIILVNNFQEIEYEVNMWFEGPKLLYCYNECKI